jgi:hypothetical protein
MLGDGSYGSVEIAGELQTTFPPPDNLLSACLSKTSIFLQWHDNSGGSSGFVVERQRDDEFIFTPIATTPAGTTTYADIGTSAFHAYHYRVRNQ